MKLSPLLHKKWSIPALSFLIPFLGMIGVMICCSFEPFGKYSMLYSDMYHQYYPFFVDFRKALLSGDSLLYNWNIGMGVDYLGLIAYYLASPLNLLSVLVPEGWLLEFFSLLTPIKLGLAGLFFSVFLKKIFSKDDLFIPLFSAFYALCAWALGYQWNIMWMDTFALLPLVALGTVSVLKERKFFLYTVTLFLSVFSNYYIGLFTCIFVLLICICYEICRCESFKKLFADILLMAAFSVLAIGMTAILELPALAALQTTQSSVNKFPAGFKLNIADKNTWLGLFDAMRQVAGNINGGLETTFKEGLPNLYCGVGTTVLAFLFLTSKEVRLRDKICSVVLLLFFIVSFIIRQLDYIWHGFHFTNMIPYRFSFLFSFVLLYMAYKAFTIRDSFRPWQLITAGALTVGILVCGYEQDTFLFWVYNGIFILLYLSFLALAFVKRTVPVDSDEADVQSTTEPLFSKRYISLGLCCVLFLEIVLNLVNFCFHFSGTSVSNYPKGTTDTESMIRYMYEREEGNLFFRAETTHSQTLNDGALNGYQGISTFTSSANVNVTKFMKALGYGAKETYNRYCFEESSPVSNLFLGIKYMLERDGKVEENAYFDDIHSFGKVHLLENNAYLPLGFLANSQLINVDFHTGENAFEFQNELFSAATGVNSDVWHILAGGSLSITSEIDDLYALSMTGYTTYEKQESSGEIVYTYTADKDGLMCIHLDLSKKNSYTVWKNGVELYSESHSLPQMLSVSDVSVGDTVEVKVKYKANEKGTLQIQAGILDEPLFRQGYDVLAASTLELDTFQNTYVSGTINCNRDGVLYTSIPQNGNWSAYVDGQAAQVITIGDAMVGLILPEGEHTITFAYSNKAFLLGAVISAVCLVTFLCVSVYYYRNSFRSYKGKFKNK